MAAAKRKKPAKRKTASRGKEDDGEEDGHRPSQDREEEEIIAKARGSSPRLLYSFSKTIGYEASAGRSSARRAFL